MTRVISQDGLKVSLHHTQQPENGLKMDFQPVTNAAKRFTGNSPYVFVHWQAKPIGLRTWGVMVITPGQEPKYLSAENIFVESSEIPQFLQINEIAFNVKPTAGLIWRNSTATETNRGITIHAIGTNTINNRGTDNAIGVSGLSNPSQSKHNERIERAKASAKALRGGNEGK